MMEFACKSHESVAGNMHMPLRVLAYFRLWYLMKHRNGCRDPSKIKGWIETVWVRKQFWSDVKVAAPTVRTPALSPGHHLL